jgi:hypothetical protein
MAIAINDASPYKIRACEVRLSGLEPETYGLKVCPEGYAARREDYENPGKYGLFAVSASGDFRQKVTPVW